MRRYENVQPDELLLAHQGKSTATNDLSVLRELNRLIASGETAVGECVKATNDGDMVIQFTPKITGIIPREEITYKVESDGKVHKGRAQNRVGSPVRFKVKKVTEVEKGEYEVLLSRKEAMQEIRDAYIKDYKAGKLVEGSVVQGMVIGMQEYGAFIDIGGDVYGILSVADICRVYIKEPSEILSIGDQIEVMVSLLNVKPDNTVEIAFNRENLLPDWNEIDKYFKRGETVIGRVKTIIDTGIFIELNESYEGLAEFVPGRRFEYGEKVRVKIEHIGKDKKKMKLRII